MALNINNAEVERLSAEAAELAHETKTEAIRKALLERRGKLQVGAGIPGRRTALRAYFEEDVWPKIPAAELSRVLSREEEGAMLGYGPGGY